MSEMWTRCSFALIRSLKLIYFTILSVYCVCQDLHSGTFCRDFCVSPSVRLSFNEFTVLSLFPSVLHSDFHLKSNIHCSCFVKFMAPAFCHGKTVRRQSRTFPTGETLDLHVVVPGSTPVSPLPPFPCQNQRNHALQIANCLLPISWVERFQFAIITFTHGTNKKISSLPSSFSYV